MKHCESIAKRICTAKHLLDEEDKKPAEKMAIAWNSKIIEDAKERRKVDSSRYPKVLGVNVWTDDKELNRLFKEHQILLQSFENTCQEFDKKLYRRNAGIGEASLTDAKFIRFWKNIIENTKACIKTQRDPQVSINLRSK